MKYRLIYFLISAIIIGAGIFSLVRWRLPLSIDFTGGAVIEYETNLNIDQIKERFSNKNQDVGIESAEIVGSHVLLRTKEVVQEKAQVDEASIVRFESVGPTFSAEIFRKTAVAVAIASFGILLWIAWQFKSIQFGISAVLATLHDSLVLIGLFSLLGHFAGAPVDILFVTALLTTLAFSVHDTIVVFDRIRETKRKIGGSVYAIANLAITQTMVRSLNNSLTIIFVLLALVLLGGQTLFWFMVALLIGVVTGTYSSPFVAVPLLVTWEEVKSKLRR